MPEPGFAPPCLPPGNVSEGRLNKVHPRLGLLEGPDERMTADPLAAYSDAVAVIVTIMVLELKAPD